MEPIKVTIDIKSGFSVRSGYGLAGVLDDTIVRDSRNLPYIPGTSLKGIIRQACEELAFVSGRRPYDKVVDELKALKKPANFTPVTRIFGSPFNPALFEFHSAYLRPGSVSEADMISSAAVWAESHNKIDRSTRTAMQGHLFTHEVAMGKLGIADYTFKFSIIPLEKKEKIDDSLIGLLIAGIRFADRIGAKKSRGKGVIDMRICMPYEKRDLEQWIRLAFQEGN